MVVLGGHVNINGDFLPAYEMFELAEADGFYWVNDFLGFFNSHYGENFKGKIIKWKNFRKAEQ